MLGVTNLLRIVVPLSLMCAPQDVAVLYQVKSPITNKPTILLYDNCPGGVGLAQKAYSMQNLLLEKALQIVTDCPCEHGCPSCAGPVGEIGTDGKQTAIALLKELIRGTCGTSCGRWRAAAKSPSSLRGSTPPAGSAGSSARWRTSPGPWRCSGKR